MRIEDSEFYGYMSGGVLRLLLDKDEVLDLLMADLDGLGKPAQQKRLAKAEKLAAIEAHALHHQKQPTSPWHRVGVPEILVGLLWRASLSAPKKWSDVFYWPKKETDLEKPVADWLRERGWKVYREVAMGTKRPDLVGYKEGGRPGSHRIVAVELKNEVSQLKRGLDRMTTFGEYSH
ncbi:MAG: hypothetical protein ABI548_25730 [Polyangiaceae bacterium]